MQLPSSVRSVCACIGMYLFVADEHGVTISRMLGKLFFTMKQTPAVADTPVVNLF
ncbi:MAG: hypothetical protein AAFW70_15800 [Cyanobacteria bacterium J06635_10]